MNNFDIEIFVMINIPNFLYLYIFQCSKLCSAVVQNSYILSTHPQANVKFDNVSLSTVLQRSPKSDLEILY